MQTIFAASWMSQALPGVAYIATPRRTRAAALVALGSLVSVLATAIGEILIVTAGNNLIVAYISSPVTAACYIWALREWQTGARAQRVLTWGVIAFLLVWIGLVAWVEDVRNWFTYGMALYSLVILAPAIWTLVRRGTTAVSERLEQNDWFWICVGLGLHGAVNALAAPAGSLLYARRRLDVLETVWSIRAGLTVVTYLLISWGILRGPAREA